MSTDRLAEMVAEISRLHTKIVGLEAIVADNEARVANTHGMAAEIERLRARVTQLEALVTVGAGTMGTLQQPTPDEPSTITHDIPPNAPR